MRKISMRSRIHEISEAFHEFGMWKLNAYQNSMLMLYTEKSLYMAFRNVNFRSYLRPYSHVMYLNMEIYTQHL